MFARDDLTGALQQRSQNPQRLGLNLDRALPAEKPSGPGIEFEIAETQPLVAAADPSRDPLLSVVYILMSDEERLSEDSCGWYRI